VTVAENVETLPQRQDGNREITRFNALRHGVLSQYTVLPGICGTTNATTKQVMVADGGV